MTIDNDNDMMLKVKKLIFRTTFIYQYLVHAADDAHEHKNNLETMNRPENDRRSGNVTGLTAVNNGTVPVR